MTPACGRGPVAGTRPAPRKAVRRRRGSCRDPSLGRAGGRSPRRRRGAARARRPPARPGVRRQTARERATRPRAGFEALPRRQPIRQPRRAPRFSVLRSAAFEDAARPSDLGGDPLPERGRGGRRGRRQALEGIRRSGRTGEVIVVDNGVDRPIGRGRRGARRERRRASRAAATGARTSPGSTHARGEYIVMGDADGTYPARRARPRSSTVSSGRRPRHRLALQGHDPRRRDAVGEPLARQPDAHGDAQRALRRQGLGRALRDARASPLRPARARPPLDRHGVRVGDGVQGIPPRARGQRDPDRLLPAHRRVEAEPLRRRVAARPLHAPVQPELAVPRPGRRSSCSSGSPACSCSRAGPSTSSAARGRSTRCSGSSR